MAVDILSEVLSSPNSLGIAALISVRPRTQSELAELTGVSVPGVLKHLRRLKGLGLIEEKKLEKNLFTVRKVYVRKGASVGDFSLPNLRVVKLQKESAAFVRSRDPLSDLEAISQDLVLQKRRIRDRVRRLGRMTEELLEDQNTLSKTAETAGLGAGGSLILQTVFTEENMGQAERVLVRHFGVKGGRRSIDRVMSATKSIAKK